MPRRSFAASFGHVVRFRRDRLGLSQEKLADQTGLDRTTIGLIERGERSPSLDTVHLIAGALGEKLSTLVGEAEVLAGSRRRRSGS